MVKIFDVCKFWLHYFDQAKMSAWPINRRPIPKSMLELRSKMIILMNEYNSSSGTVISTSSLNEILNTYKMNPMKPRLWKYLRAIMGAETFTVYFPVCQDIMLGHLMGSGQEDHLRTEWYHK